MECRMAWPIHLTNVKSYSGFCIKTFEVDRPSFSYLPPKKFSQVELEQCRDSSDSQISSLLYYLIRVFILSHILLLDVHVFTFICVGLNSIKPVDKDKINEKRSTAYTHSLHRPMHSNPASRAAA